MADHWDIYPFEGVHDLASEEPRTGSGASRAAVLFEVTRADAGSTAEHRRLLGMDTSRYTSYGQEPRRFLSTESEMTPHTYSATSSHVN